MAAEAGGSDGQRSEASRAGRRSRDADGGVNNVVFDSPLHKAAYAGELRRVKSILQRNKHLDFLNINSRNRLGCTALRLAATAGHADCVRLLIRHGADVNVSDIKAQTPLFVAVKNRHLECVQVLLDAGADPDGDPYSLCSPVYIAAMDGFTDGLKALLDNGADPDVSLLRVGWFNSTPLYVSIAYHHYSCLKVLLLAGAEPDRIPTETSPTCTTAYNQVMTLTRRPSLSVTRHPLPLTRSTASQDDFSSTGSRSNSESVESDFSVGGSQVVSSQNNIPNMETLAPPPLPPPLLAPPFRPRVSTSHTCQSLYDATVKHNVETEYVQLLYDFGASLYRCVIYRRPDVAGIDIRTQVDDRPLEGSNTGGNQGSLEGTDRPLGVGDRPEQGIDRPLGGANVQVDGIGSHEVTDRSVVNETDAGSRSVGGANQTVGGANQTVGGAIQTVGGANLTVGGANQTVGGANQTVEGVNRPVGGDAVSVGGGSRLGGGITGPVVGDTTTVGRGYDNTTTGVGSITDRERLTLYSRDNECAQYIRQLLANPRSLMSASRLAIRRAVGRPRVNRMSEQTLGLPNKILRYLNYEF